MAVRVAVWALVSVPVVAVNDALAVPEAIVTEAGTVKAELLLERVTTAPPEGAATERVAVQVEEALLPRLAGAQVRLLITTCTTKERLAVCVLPL